MTFKRLLGIVGALCAVAVLTGSVGAGAARTPTKHAIDLSTRGAVAKYLRSIHVNPKGVVIQRGLRNYAGSSCPGAGWSCTSSSHPVVQVASGAGRNVFQCASSSCAVVQSSAAALATNTAKCIKTTGLSQSCSITQSSASANNEAIVVQIATKTSGLTQSGSQTAQIIQKATGGSAVANSNTACVLQTTTIDGSTAVLKKGMPVTVTLDAHQSVSIAQDSLFGGNTVKNASAAGGGTCGNDTLTQDQSITSKASGSGAITQNENAAASGPNMLLEIKQNQSTGFFGTANGVNTTKFSQTSSLAASAGTPTGPVNQTQASAGGGLQATVNQFSHDLSTSTATQYEKQCEHAETSGDPAACVASAHAQVLPGYLLTQVQHGPVRCCSNQADNGNDMFTISQTSIQSNDTGANQTNNLQADCTTSGTCTATQTTNINGTSSTNTQTGSDVHAGTTCTGSACTSSTVQVSGNTISAANTDVAESGFGGMRGNGVGSIGVSGVSGAVTKAFLFWNGPTNSSDPTANASVNFGGTPITGTNIGFASSNCWTAFANSQSYRADVTPLVTGNGTYSLNNFTKADAEINGVALIVFYNDGNTANDRNVVMFNGNDSNVASTFDLQGWDQTISNVPYPGSGSASLDFVVSDGQVFSDDDLVLNGSPFVAGPAIFQGDSTPAGPGPPPPDDVNGRLWDVKSFDITSFLTAPSNNLHLTTGLLSDCLSLVVAAANVPASSGPIILSPAVALRQQAQAARVQSAPDRSAPSGSARPSAQVSGGLARTASSPLRPGRSG